MKREDGFYWVKYNGGDEPAFFYNGTHYPSTSYWLRIGSDDVWCDDDFDNIGTKIKKPED